MDCELMYKEDQIAALLHALPEDDPSKRRLFFEDVLLVRRRNERRFQESPVHQLFVMPDEWTLMKAKAWQVRVRSAIIDAGLGLRDAFNMFDTNNNGTLSDAELFGALMWLELPSVTA